VTTTNPVGGTPSTRTLTLHVDESRCQGHGICHLVAPHLLEVDDEGRGLVISARIDADSVEDAEVAVSRCPEQAVVLN
jgi:ferredoxin